MILSKDILLYNPNLHSERRFGWGWITLGNRSKYCSHFCPWIKLPHVILDSSFLHALFLLELRSFLFNYSLVFCGFFFFLPNWSCVSCFVLAFQGIVTRQTLSQITVNKCTDKGFTRRYYIVFFVCLNEQIAVVNRGPFERVAMGTDRPSTSSFHMFGQHEEQYAN